jgi:hypothetical protein
VKGVTIDFLGDAEDTEDTKETEDGQVTHR